MMDKSSYVRDRRQRPRWSQLYDPLSKSTMVGKGGKKQNKRWDASARMSVGMTLTDEASPGAFMADVWEIPLLAPNAAEGTGYPTQKPEALLERVLTACSYEGDTVLDPYFGSGTTGVVAKRLGRKLGRDRRIACGCSRRCRQGPPHLGGRLRLHPS